LRAFLISGFTKVDSNPDQSVTMCMDAQVSREAGKPAATSPWGRQIKTARYCGLFYFLELELAFELRVQ
jgi:hypothetical protein